MEKRKTLRRKTWLCIAAICAVVILMIIVMSLESEPEKNNSESVADTQTEQRDNTKTPDSSKQNGLKVTKQESDKQEEHTPVTVNTDGTVDIDELDGYEEETEKDENVSESRIHISSIGGYSGAYVEDGSDEEVENVLAIVVTNVSEQFLQYSEITMESGDKKAVFELSNLPSGASALVLAKDRTPAGSENWTYVDDITAFIEKAELHEDEFSWEPGDGFLLLTYKGQKNYSKVHIYYKNTLDGTYVGGITYRITFEDMKVGETRARLSKHFDGNNSHVMMIDYID